MRKSFRGVFLIIVLVILLIVFIAILSTIKFSFKKTYMPATALSEILPRFRFIDLDELPVKSDKNNNGNNDSKDIVIGAKKQLKIKAKNIFLKGSDQSNYYKGGDPPEQWAINTDIIARSFKEAGFDLRTLVNEDIKKNISKYPLKAIWNQNVPDIDIDYRRIQNLEVFFKRNAQNLNIRLDPSNEENLNTWLPGDVVFFDMDEDGFTDNAGIVSDFTARNGVPKVIYNDINPGYTTEENILGKKIITGHYRLP
ncbi:MAG: DUF1287 domain-containing protein [Actinobacteria bacterium]|nr:DUF1287 domain-containing protein [Actinomycetota bacterium]MCL6087031.1 DUF1287 domain-containing protein [Actinomycetota bacterium]